MTLIIITLKFHIYIYIEYTYIYICSNVSLIFHIYHIIIFSQFLAWRYRDVSRHV